MEIWLIFTAIVIICISVDLFILKKKNINSTYKQDISQTIIWIVVALFFNLYIFYIFGSQAGINFFTGFIIEKSLSLDNIFVFIVIFKFFAVPLSSQPKVLLWGIIGQITLRIIFIKIGVVLIDQIPWIFYVFGGLLVFTAYGILFNQNRVPEFNENIIVKLCKKIILITPSYHAQKLWVKINFHWYATPLFIVLINIIISDIVFAVDSIPAIFAITQNTYIIITSNVFAILGLRPLFFLTSKFLDRFYYLSYGLGLILFFIGLKMILHFIYPISSLHSLLIVTAILIIIIGMSVIKTKKTAGSYKS